MFLRDIEGEAQRSFSYSDILVIDLETTGIDPDKHEIIQIGACKLNLKTQIIDNPWSIYTVPEHWETASKESLEVNHISKSLLDRKAVPLEHALLELENRFYQDGLIISSWGIDFDKGFLTHAYNSVSLLNPFAQRWLDARTFAWIVSDLIGKQERPKLNDFLRSLGLKFDGREHDASADAKNTARALLEGYKRLKALSRATGDV